MINSKISALCGLSIAATMAHASDTLYFFNQQSRIGCGTITDVRNVNQAPLYDREYEMLRGGRGGTGDVAVLVSNLGIVGQAVAAITSLGVDSARDKSIALEAVNAPANGVWTNVKAIRVVMDDGREINLPLTAQPKLGTGLKYESGRRVEVYLIKERNSIQLGMQRKPPLPDEKLYAAFCRRSADAADAEAALTEKAHLVQEDKIVE